MIFPAVKQGLTLALEDENCSYLIAPLLSLTRHHFVTFTDDDEADEPTDAVGNTAGEAVEDA
jgi:hypothetical protein